LTLLSDCWLLFRGVVVARTVAVQFKRRPVTDRNSIDGAI
jgi:hypothetical protein